MSPNISSLILKNNTYKTEVTTSVFFPNNSTSLSLIIFLVIIIVTSTSCRIQSIQPLDKLLLPLIICQLLQVIPKTNPNVQSLS
ncbi:hypothetical protein Hanom_Chr06g00518031 [Helianthus anomalus]